MNLHARRHVRERRHQRKNRQLNILAPYVRPLKVVSVKDVATSGSAETSNFVYPHVETLLQNVARENDVQETNDSTGKLSLNVNNTHISGSTVPTPPVRRRTNMNRRSRPHGRVYLHNGRWLVTPTITHTAANLENKQIASTSAATTTSATSTTSATDTSATVTSATAITTTTASPYTNAVLANTNDKTDDTPVKIGYRLAIEGLLEMGATVEELIQAGLLEKPPQMSTDTPQNLEEGFIGFSEEDIYFPFNRRLSPETASIVVTTCEENQVKHRQMIVRMPTMRSPASRRLAPPPGWRSVPTIDSHFVPAPTPANSPQHFQSEILFSLNHSSQELTSGSDHRIIMHPMVEPEWLAENTRSENVQNYSHDTLFEPLNNSIVDDNVQDSDDLQHINRITPAVLSLGEDFHLVAVEAESTEEEYVQSEQNQEVPSDRLPEKQDPDSRKLEEMMEEDEAQARQLAVEVDRELEIAFEELLERERRGEAGNVFDSTDSDETTSDESSDSESEESESDDKKKKSKPPKPKPSQPEEPQRG